MKSILKSLLFLLISFVSNSLFAQDQEKTVSLVVSAQGKTLEEAKQNALRNAIEQAFGTFISSKTEVLNDSLVKDEIVSIANGNIQSFEIVSEVKIPDGGIAITLKAIVSVTKLSSFCESKGVNVDFKGGLFASNILLQEFYEKNEIITISNLVEILKKIANKSFDYSVNASNPYSQYGSWLIPITIEVFANSNFLNISTLLETTLNGITLSSSDLENYSKLNKPTYPVTLVSKSTTKIYYLRSINSIKNIIELIYSFNRSISNFYVYNGIDRFTLDKVNFSSDYSEKYDFKSFNNLLVFDEGFRVILKNHRGASVFNSYNYSPDDLRSKPVFDYVTLYDDGHYLPEYFVEVFKKDFYVDKSYTYKTLENTYYSSNFDGYEKAFKPLKKIFSKDSDLGLVISFFSVNTNSSIIKFKFCDFKTLDELKRITKYELFKND